jgi:hypothetical protein
MDCMGAAQHPTDRRQAQRAQQPHTKLPSDLDSHHLTQLPLDGRVARSWSIQAQEGSGPRRPDRQLAAQERRCSGTLPVRESYPYHRQRPVTAAWECASAILMLSACKPAVRSTSSVAVRAAHQDLPRGYCLTRVGHWLRLLHRVTSRLDLPPLEGTFPRPCLLHMLTTPSPPLPPYRHTTNGIVVERLYREEKHHQVGAGDCSTHPYMIHITLLQSSSRPPKD